MRVPVTAERADRELTDQEAHAIGVEAFVHFYPLISMDVTRRLGTNFPAGQRPGFGPANAFHHFRAYPTADFDGRWNPPVVRRSD
jgi:hypothetical protein